MLVIHDYYDSDGNFLYSVEEEMEEVVVPEVDATTDEVLNALLGVTE